MDGQKEKQKQSEEKELKKEGEEIKEEKRGNLETIGESEGTKKKLSECLCKREEYLDGWKRERAGFLNYKKEELERLGGLMKYANEGLILKFLPILDNFHIAEKEIQEELRKDKCVEGLLSIKSQIMDFLKKQGVEEIKSIGEKFDPNFMEAVGEIETKEKENGVVAEEVKKGYLFQGKIIRPVKVKVAK
ncbi:MAG: nucleotide exchange factor GrpE [Candidatus Nealsonbacteria bacterium RIFCSPHIGHO2_12_FULL_38_18]|nr:MAG: nucleotide exchange factor GrpE [Candidatus Nealsonbacteria bacterium RIFCSPHIGHO2_12_FULL_38_18]